MEAKRREQRARRNLQVAITCTFFICMVIGAMSTMHAYRRLLGTPHVYNSGQFDTVLLMMDDAPVQFYELFRMTPDTFRWLDSYMYQKAVRKHRLQRKPGPLPFQEVHTRRLMWTIWFLATGHSYRQMSFIWGQTLCWADLLVEEIEAMKHEFIRWPVGAAMFQTCRGFERLRGFKGLCGCIDGSFIRIRAPWQEATDPATWNTYKKFYALQLLAVCNAR